MVADLVQRKVDLIVVETTAATREAKQATSVIPIVMTSVADPVGSGLVMSLSHPGGNITGFSNMASDIVGKRLQLLKDTFPGLARVAVLWNPDTPPHANILQEIKSLAAPQSLEPIIVGARTSQDLALAISAFKRSKAQAFYVLEDAIFFDNRATLNKLAAHARLPAMFAQRRVVEEGGLMSYGPDFLDLFHRSAGYVDKILKGANPGDLPVEQPTKFELVVNLKTAKALGITIPESILLRADEVIR